MIKASRIPSRLHFIFLSKDEPVPAAFMECHERAKRLHPGWDIRIYNEDDAQEVLRSHFPELLPVYDAYIYTVQRSDVLRVILVYLFGGFYMDMDMLSLKSLDELCGEELVLAKERLLSEDELNLHEAKHTLRIGNYMFGGRPGHPFWLSVLQACVRAARKKVFYENDVIKTTGPELLTNVYHQHRKIYRDITLLDNIDRRCLTQWHDAISCHFGNFAAHLHTGTWRWKGRKSDLPPRKLLPETVYRQASAAIYRQLEKGTLSPTDVVMLQMDANALRALPEAAPLYEKCRAVCKTVDSARQLKDMDVLVLGDPRMSAVRVSPATMNTLYTTITDDQVTGEWIACLNASYHHCIVAHAYMKDVLIAAGATVPVTTIPLGFRRGLRNFNGDDEEQEGVFTLACQVTGEGSDADELTAVCERLKRDIIPGLKLLLIKTPGDRKRLFTTRFAGIHCFLFTGAPGRCSPGPMEALYQGIPSVILDHPVYDAITASGFCKVAEDKTYIGQALSEVFHDYQRYNEMAIEGSRWIEDKWQLGSTVAAIFKTIKSSERKWIRTTTPMATEPSSLHYINPV